MRESQKQVWQETIPCLETTTLENRNSREVNSMERVLDQFYTQPQIAKQCVDFAMSHFTRLAGKRPFFIEPSAGDGVFYDLLPAHRRYGMDIAPKHAQIVKGNYLDSAYRSPVRRGRTVVIGNPPFGKRGKLAVAFMNKAFEAADTVAFIVPVIFRKHFIHKQLVEGARWIDTLALPRSAFRTADKDNYTVNTEFQIWTRLDTMDEDMRLYEPPAIRHDDFEMWQYNNTKQALKMFDNDFDFAVPCQGYQDYTRRETDADACEKHKQWMLFKPHSGRADKILRRVIDYARLSLKNTTTVPGFRKGDVVQEYLCHA